jgi:hypothetical protein
MSATTTQEERRRFLLFSFVCYWVLGVWLLSTSSAWAAAPIVVPGLESEHIVETRVEGGLLLLRTEEGRLYSIPLDSFELQSLPIEKPSMSASLSIPDIMELLRSGVSEGTIRAYIEANRPPNGSYDLTKGDLIGLERAGASDAFLQYLIRVGRYGPRSTYVTWRSPEGPRREEPQIVVRESTEETYQSGIPYFPYIYPGCNPCNSYPHYPVQPIHPGHPTFPGRGGGDSTSSNGKQGTRPGYYPDEVRSIASGYSTKHQRQKVVGKPMPVPLPSGRSSNGQLWLRWKGSSGRRQGETVVTHSEWPGSRARSSSPGAFRTKSSGTGYRTGGSPGSMTGTGSSGRSGGATQGRGITGSRSGTRTSGSRSISGKKK